MQSSIDPGPVPVNFGHRAAIRPVPMPEQPAIHDPIRHVRVIEYPVVPALYIRVAGIILVVLFANRPATTWPGFLIVLLGIPIYFLIRRFGPKPVTLESHAQAGDLQSAE